MGDAGPGRKTSWWLKLTDLVTSFSIVLSQRTKLSYYRFFRLRIKQSWIACAFWTKVGETMLWSGRNGLNWQFWGSLIPNEYMARYRQSWFNEGSFTLIELVSWWQPWGIPDVFTPSGSASGFSLGNKLVRPGIATITGPDGWAGYLWRSIVHRRSAASLLHRQLLNKNKSAEVQTLSYWTIFRY